MTLPRPTEPRWNEVTAVLGGRFDPPHLGHREAARGLFAHPGVKQILVLPSATPPHKPAFASAEDRVEMTRLNFRATHKNPYPESVQIDTREIERSSAKPNHPNYTYETLQELRQTYPQLAFVIGADQLEQLNTWYRFPDILHLAHWIVLERQPHGQKIAYSTLQQWEASGLVRSVRSQVWQIQRNSTFLIVVPTDAPALSSTQIRESITRTGSPPDHALHEDVQAYLKVRRIYGININK